MEPRPGVLTVEEAAVLLKVHEDTVRKAIRLGEIPVRKVGKQFRIPVAALHDWLRSAKPVRTTGEPISSWP